MRPTSPTSSATFVEHSSPAYRASPKAKRKSQSLCRSRSPLGNYSLHSPRGNYTLRSPKGSCSSFNSALFDSESEGHDIPIASFVSLAPEILGDTNMPPEDLKVAVAAQYATCEKLRHLIMTRIWQVEEASRWTSFLNQSINKLKKEHEAAEDGLRLWIENAQKECTEVSEPSSSVTTNLLKAKESLKFVQGKYNDMEGLLIAHGVTDTDLIMANDGGEDSESGRD
ncbi:uncharacterized protein F5891DRAFT_1195242 [Suillus fuscotomentosus]|uniref:Uncharacterized protein n=1 Tax=Suillus fuscotomentosus TaxID=1912939 RepID=A0AAD4HF84_9AGAM|nr:uncharacterized protein F5891DRAFT_1195242 [Suillus fuscotomentosus]KAG1894403.1 hypothetical protein F5891DRAFT_1195242 [Suillus fuscotomentosus]